MGQTFSFQQIKDSATATLENQVGIELARFFELSPKNNIDISYLNWIGRENSKWLEPSQEVKVKRFLEASVYFVFKHPSLDSADFEISFWLTMDKKLSTRSNFDLLKLPEFIREGRPNDWLTKLARHNISDTLNFEKQVQRILTNITYDQISRKYYFEVRGIYYSKAGYYYYENFWINVRSAKIEKHFYTKYYVCSMI